MGSRLPGTPLREASKHGQSRSAVSIVFGITGRELFRKTQASR